MTYRAKCARRRAETMGLDVRWAIWPASRPPPMTTTSITALLKKLYPQERVESLMSLRVRVAPWWAQLALERRWISEDRYWHVRNTEGEWLESPLLNLIVKRSA